jgi:hypothetical protein
MQSEQLIQLRRADEKGVLKLSLMKTLRQSVIDVPIHREVEG